VPCSVSSWPSKTCAISHVLFRCQAVRKPEKHEDDVLVCLEMSNYSQDESGTLTSRTLMSTVSTLICPNHSKQRTINGFLRLRTIFNAFHCSSIVPSGAEHSLHYTTHQQLSPHPNNTRSPAAPRLRSPKRGIEDSNCCVSITSYLTHETAIHSCPVLDFTSHASIPTPTPTPKTVLCFSRATDGMQTDRSDSWK
jgi:hypothetical protein